jgi:capsid protein
MYEVWLSLEIAAGRISCPGWQDPRLRAAWTAHRLNGTPMPNIDPAKTAQADLMYASMGAQHLGDVARNLNGSDFTSNAAHLAVQVPALSEAGLTPFAKSAPSSPPGSKDGEDSGGDSESDSTTEDT